MLIFQDYKDLPSGVQEFASGAYLICQSDYKDLPTGLNIFSPELQQLAGVFTKMENEGQRQFQRITVFNSRTSSL